MYKKDINIGFRWFPANHIKLLDRKRNNLCERRKGWFFFSQPAP